MNLPISYILTLMGIATGVALWAQKPAPVAPVLPKTDTFHGQTFTDDYAGLRDPKNPQVMRYLRAENAYTDQAMRSTRGLQKQIFEELRSRMVEQDSSLPDYENGYWYYYRYNKGSQYPAFYRRRGHMSAPEELLLDEAATLRRLKAYSASEYVVSHDNRLMAYLVDYKGNFEMTALFQDLSNPKNRIDDRLLRLTGLVWGKDNQTVYYSCQDSINNRSYRVYKHRLGSPTDQDQLLYEEKDPNFSCYLQQSKSRELLFIHSESSDASEVYYLPLDGSADRPVCIEPRSPEHLYSVEHLNGRFYILSNWGHLYNNQLFTAEINQGGRQDWKQCIAHNPEVYLMDFEPLNKYIVAQENRAGNYRLALYDLEGKLLKTIEPKDLPKDEPGIFGLWSDTEPEADSFRLSYTSLRLPYRVYTYDPATDRAQLLYSRPVPGYQPEDYVSLRLQARAEDGKLIPITLLCRKDRPQGKPSPCLIEAYGSYGVGSPPEFNRSVFPLVDRGWVYAVAHVRGGDDMGKHWYLDGKLLRKKNTFMDFVACTEHLQAQGWADPKRTAAMGASAGGLLMGALCNMRPDLYKAVILGVPFVDVINTMSDPSLPLTTLEYSEWGNPADKTYFDYMRSYSPYDNVQAQAYPNMLFFTGLHDEQVGYWEPTKMVAKLRRTKTDNNLLLLQVNMSAGHAGSSGRFDALNEYAFNWAFLLKSCGE